MFSICLGETILIALCPLDQKETHDSSRYMQGFQKFIISMVVYVTTENGCSMRVSQ
jgi:hypothetical protein